MGCQVSECQEANEFLLTQPTPSFESTIVSNSYTLSDKSTKPSIDTFVRNQKLLTSSPLAFSSVFSTARMFLRDQPNFPDLAAAMKVWRQTVYTPLQEALLLAEDMHTTIAYESTGEMFTITHEVDGVRVFTMIQTFCRQLQSLQLETPTPRIDCDYLAKIEDFLLSLTPLTVCFYLHLGRRIDCGMCHAGIGVSKPMDQQQLSEFLTLAQDNDGVERWCAETQPIPVSFRFQVGSKEATVALYLFDGEKDLNFQRAFSIFDFCGAPLPDNIAEFLKMASGEELQCILSLTPSGLSRIGVQVTGLDHVRVMELGTFLDSPFEEKKNGKFGRTGPGAPAVLIQLTDRGFVMTQVVSIC